MQDSYSDHLITHTIATLNFHNSIPNKQYRQKNYWETIKLIRQVNAFQNKETTLIISTNQMGIHKNYYLSLEHSLTSWHKTTPRSSKKLYEVSVLWALPDEANGSNFINPIPSALTKKGIWLETSLKIPGKFKKFDPLCHHLSAFGLSKPASEYVLSGMKKRLAFFHLQTEEWSGNRLCRMNRTVVVYCLVWFILKIWSAWLKHFVGFLIYLSDHYSCLWKSLLA